MYIGEKIKQLRIKNGLTQEEVASRCELSKGFISQVERDLTSPSIATLLDILRCLGTDIKGFFNETIQEDIVFGKDKVFFKEDRELRHEIAWLIPNSQKNDMEPILLKLEVDGKSQLEDSHHGEEFGYVLSGTIFVHLGERKYKVKKGESFYFKPAITHYISNAGKQSAQLLWISTPPSF